MKTFKIPVTWESYGVVEIEADSVEQALQIFKETEDDIALPTDWDYVDSSFRLSYEDDVLKELIAYNE